MTERAMIKRGKKLDPAKVEAKAFKIYGKGYRSELEIELGGSSALYTYAFSSRAPKKLFEIHQHLNSIN